MFRAARVFTAVLAAVAAVMVTAGEVEAVVPDASASFTGPAPNPVPAGSSATASAQFSLGSDVGPVTVTVDLPDSGGLGSLAVVSASAELANCDDSGGTAITCEWDGDSLDSPQTIDFTVAVDASAAPNQGWSLVALIDSPTDLDPPQNLASAQFGIAPPAGSTTLSGQVITTGGAPVAQACIFILSGQYAFQAITDDDGSWSLGGLPDDYLYAVAAIPPFTGTFGPCANNGPPPVPADGELQPVFYNDIWIDLSDPDLLGGDPYAYAIARGAVSIADSRAGIVSCLTTAPGDVVPRPACVQAATATTTTTTPTTTRDTELPATGSEHTRLSLAATLLVAAGGVALTASRRHGPRREP